MMVSVHMVNGESGNPKMEVFQMEDSDDGKCSHGQTENPEIPRWRTVMMVSVHMVNRESGNPKMEVFQMEDSDDGKCSHGQRRIRKSQDGCDPDGGQ